MATIRKTITQTEAQDEWIKAKVANGDFTNDSEYFRDLIRRDQEKERALTNEIINQQTLRVSEPVTGKARERRHS